MSNKTYTLVAVGVLLATVIVLVISGMKADRSADEASKSTLEVVPAASDSAEPEATEKKASKTTEPAETEAAKTTKKSTKKAKTTAAETTASVTTTTAAEDNYVEYKFRSKKLLNEHFEKHGGEFDYDTAAEYEKGASDVINNPDALYKVEAEDGDGIYYIEETNEFVVLSTDGYIRTYFKPSRGIDYFNSQ
jgi:pyocin large subunit-like protein